MSDRFVRSIWFLRQCIGKVLVKGRSNLNRLGNWQSRFICYWYLLISTYYSILINCYFSFSGNTPETRGTAFIVYDDIFDAKNACDHLSGFNVCNRYLVVLYYRSNKAFKGMDIDKKQEEIDTLKKKYGISSEDLRK